MTPSATCSTSLVLVLGINCLSRVSNRRQSSSTISGPNLTGPAHLARNGSKSEVGTGPVRVVDNSLLATKKAAWLTAFRAGAGVGPEWPLVKAQPKRGRSNDFWGQGAFLRRHSPNCRKAGCFPLVLLRGYSSNPHPALLGTSPDTRRSLPVVPLIRNQRYYGEAPASVRRGSGAVRRR